MKYKMVVFDIDGTLTVTANEIPKSTIKTIEKLRENGYKVIIATGRERENIGIIQEITGIKNYIACNGHYVEHEGEILYHYNYPRMIVEEVKKICDEKNHSCGLSNGKGTYLYNQKELKEEYKEHSKRIKIIDEIDENEVENIIILTGESETGEFAKVEKEHILGPWGNGMYDLVKKDRSKAKGIEEVAKMMGITSDEVVTFGDGLNDLEMTEYAGLGIAMGNGKDELKKVANHITSHVKENGVYNACKKFNLI